MYKILKYKLTVWRSINRAKKNVYLNLKQATDLICKEIKKERYHFHSKGSLNKKNQNFVPHLACKNRQKIYCQDNNWEQTFTYEAIMAAYYGLVLISKDVNVKITMLLLCNNLSMMFLLLIGRHSRFNNSLIGRRTMLKCY
jgi:hypothetical protein